MTEHRHRMKTRTIGSFAQCCAGADCKPAAHGGVSYQEICACGAVKRINSTGTVPSREETSGWLQGAP